MTIEVQKTVKDLDESIRKNAPEVAACIRHAGVEPDPAVVYSVAKYFAALSQLARE